MRNRIRHLYRDEQGMSFVYVGLGFLAFMTATTLSIDIGMWMTARSQAQNAADAGALAGAVALGFNDFNDRSTTGPAVQSAISTAVTNNVIAEPPSVKPEDVSFPNDAAGRPTRVKVNAFRTADRNNPVKTMMASMFGLKTVDIGATATAEASPATAATCVKPFMIPDRWKEASGTFNPMTSTFNMYDNKGNLLPSGSRDTYVPPTNKANMTGYDAVKDKGMQLILRAGTGNNIEPSMYFSWKMPGDDIGGDFYRNNISGCNQTLVPLTDKPYYLIQEPGDMSGPTKQGIDDLIAKDPDAVWNDSCKCIERSKFGTSPRVTPIPLYDPAYYATGKASGRNADFKLANILGFFVEKRDGNQVYGRITPISGVMAGTGTALEGAFPVAIQLVQ